MLEILRRLPKELTPEETAIAIDRRASLIRRAKEVALELGDDVTWRDLMPHDFFASNVVIGGVTGDVNIGGYNSNNRNSRVHVTNRANDGRRISVRGTTADSDKKSVERESSE